jgi:t-SNARE complex subunit (syntaxin)
MHRVNALHRDMSDLVNEQGNMVDVIGEEMLKAR